MNNLNPFLDPKSPLNLSLEEYGASIKGIVELHTQVENLLHGEASNPETSREADERLWEILDKQKMLQSLLLGQYALVVLNWQGTKQNILAEAEAARKVKEAAAQKAEAEKKAAAEKLAAEKAEAARIRHLLASHPAVG